MQASRSLSNACVHSLSEIAIVVLNLLVSRLDHRIKGLVLTSKQVSTAFTRFLSQFLQLISLEHDLSLGHFLNGSIKIFEKESVFLDFAILDSVDVHEVDVAVISKLVFQDS